MLLNLRASPVLFYYLYQREIRCLCFYHSALSLAEHNFKLWILSLFLLNGLSKLTWPKQSTTAGWGVLGHFCTAVGPAKSHSLPPLLLWFILHSAVCDSGYLSALNTFVFFFFCSCRWGSVTGAGATKSSPGIFAFEESYA